VGVQLAVVAADGSLMLSVAAGSVAYTSWRALTANDAFPLGSPSVARILTAASVARSLRMRGVLTNSTARGVWPRCPGPTDLSLEDLVHGGVASGVAEAIVDAPPKPSTRMIAQYETLVAWLENAQQRDPGTPTPPWWPPICHVAACGALLRAVGAAPLGQAVRNLFADAGASSRLVSAVTSPVLVSKQVMTVEGAEVEAAQDNLLASLGAAELRCMHLADACILNHDALRQATDLPCGLAAPAEALALVAAHAFRQGLVPAWLLESADDLTCIQRGPSGELAVVLLSCANIALARELATVAVNGHKA